MARAPRDAHRSLVPNHFYRLLPYLYQFTTTKSRLPALPRQSQQPCLPPPSHTIPTVQGPPSHRRVSYRNQSGVAQLRRRIRPANRRLQEIQVLNPVSYIPCSPQVRAIRSSTHFRLRARHNNPNLNPSRYPRSSARFSLFDSRGGRPQRRCRFHGFGRSGIGGV